MSQIERTLAILKPDAVSRGVAGEILSLIERNEFRIRGMKMLRLSRTAAEGFYDVHRGKPFFPGLIEFMTEGPVVVLALEREDAIEKWREVMGATNPADAAEGTAVRSVIDVDIPCEHLRIGDLRSQIPGTEALD